MKTRITAWPVNNELLESLGIREDSVVKSTRIGYVSSKLVEAGYNSLQAYIDEETEPDGIPCMKLHFVSPM